MEHSSSLPVVAKRIWNIVRVMFFMLRKGISKRKFMVDLNMMMKRGKIAGKAIHNLMFHHHHHSNGGHVSSFPGAPREYEFSCSNSPAFPFYLTTKRHKQHNSHFFPCAHAPLTDDDVVTASAVKKALEMLNSEAAGASPAMPGGFWQSPAVRDMIYSELSSPALPGFGMSPAVRQLRITDSPFPLRDVEEGCHVDEAAEEFIMKFYNDLRKQNRMALR